MLFRTLNFSNDSINKHDLSEELHNICCYNNLYEPSVSDMTFTSTSFAEVHFYRQEATSSTHSKTNRLTYETMDLP